MAGGPGVLGRRPVRAVQRHPERPGAALRRDQRPDRRVPLAGGLHQRAHRRPAGPLRQLRARRPPGHPAGARRQRLGDRRRVRGAAASTAPTTWSWRATAPIWFTDPSYGIRSDYEGHQADEEIGGRYVYRVVPGRRTGRGAAATSSSRTGWRSAPTSSACSSWTASSTRSGCSTSMTDAGQVGLGRGSCSPPTSSATTGSGSTPGGRLWAAAHDGLHCYEPDGTLSGKLLVPEITANLCFGGPQAQPPLPDRDHLALHPAGQLPRRRRYPADRPRPAHSA